MDLIVKDDKITQNPIVTVQVYAYNKEPYIRACLDSVLNQETDFEYEVLISENPGTDKTREICIEYQEKYPEKIILVLREKNMGFFYNYFAAERMSRGKFIARCDADDYWCDKQKLQKQVDFLDSHPDYGYCYTRTRVYNDALQHLSKSYGGHPWKGFKSELLLEAVQQPAVMYRRNLFLQYLDEIQPEGKDWDMEDVPRNLWFAWNSKVKMLDDITAVYRVVTNSWSHQIDYDRQEKYYKSIRDIRLFFYHLYCPNENDLEYKINNDYHRRLIIACLKAGRTKEFVYNFSRIHHDGINDFLIDIKTIFVYYISKLIGLIRKLQLWLHIRK